MKLLLTTTPGLEDVCLDEVYEITGSEGRIFGKGRVLVEGTEKDVFLLNYTSRTVNRVILLLNHGDFASLDELYRIVKEIDFPNLFSEKNTFAIRAERHGTHNFTSIDIARITGQAVVDSFREEKGVRIRADLDNPDIVVRIEINQWSYWIGLDTSGESLHKRHYRVYQHPAPLRPTIASALIRLSEWDFDESFFDPFCGSGTICIEAARYACGIPNSSRDFLFWNLKFLPFEEFKHIKERVDGEIENKELRIKGEDISPKHIEGAKLNAEKAGVRVEFEVGDATEIKLDWDRVVTNPPYGLRVGSLKKVRRIYEGFQMRIDEGDWKRVVVLTGVPQYLQGYSDRREILYGDLKASVLIFD